MKILLCLLVVTFSQVVLANSCTELKQELKAMQLAQRSILKSMVANHETFSSTMEEFSDQLVESVGDSSLLIPAEMDQSAKAFRMRGVRALKLNQQLDQMTSDLLVRVSSCLK